MDFGENSIIQELWISENILETHFTFAQESIKV
jgi:hypothetical protein